MERTAQARRTEESNTIQRRAAMPVVFLWGVPVLVVIGGVAFLLMHH